jgi:alpha-galactosidase
MKYFILIIALFFCLPAGKTFAGDTVWLDSLSTDQSLQMWGQPQRNLNYLRGPLSIDGKTYTTGVSVWARNQYWVNLGHGSGRFIADVGVDDSSSGSVNFVIVIDGAIVWQSGDMHQKDPAKHVDIDTNGGRYMLLATEKGADGNGQDYGDWCNAHWDTDWSDPIEAYGERLNPYILTPAPSPAPHLNNPLVYGVRPNDPVVYTIPCTGLRPIKFSATGLPPGVEIDPHKGWLVGKPAEPGAYDIHLTAINAAGISKKNLKFIVGDRLALTPPMGWSSWNAWCADPTQARVLDAANSLVKFDLIDHGFTYVNIDDGWQAPRGGKFNGIQPQIEKFPDFVVMVKKVHSLGLKFGVYSGPWICSYCGYTGGSSDDPNGVWTTDLRNLPNSGHIFGQYSFAEDDVRQWTAWGVDYLKYDWWPNDDQHVSEMSNDLSASGRNIVFSVSNSASLQMGPMLQKYAQLWRASGDIRDNWPSLFNNGFSQSPWAAYSGPGHWADPDMLALGNVGFDPDGWGTTTHPTKLTPDEQYTHMSLWALLSAPLILGCDLTKLDPFTVGLLSNDDVIDVDQDTLGKPAVKVSGDYFHEDWVRPLADGSYAVGIFNLAPGGYTYHISPSDLGLSSAYTVRDLWREKDLGDFGSSFSTFINGHGVTLLRLTKKG